MIAQFHNLRFYIVLATDLVIFAVAFVGAYLLRFDFILTPYYQHPDSEDVTDSLTRQDLNILPSLACTGVCGVTPA